MIPNLTTFFSMGRNHQQVDYSANTEISTKESALPIFGLQMVECQECFRTHA